jgi:hypothetical protein
MLRRNASSRLLTCSDGAAPAFLSTMRLARTPVLKVTIVAAALAREQASQPAQR